MAEENEEIEETIEINYLDLSEYYSPSEEDKFKWLLNILEHAAEATLSEDDREDIIRGILSEESPESTDFGDGTYRLQQSDLEGKHDKL